MRPLDFLGSIKMKLGAVILAATAVSVAVATAGAAVGMSPEVSALVAGLLALGMVQFLAHGMTSPLRDMAKGAREMAMGNYERRVNATSRDEVGELARAFNMMTAELAETDRIRRDLIANVSHELRTPIGGLQAALENIVDGVQPRDEKTFRIMLLQTQRLGRLVNELLDLSRLESRTLPLEYETVGLKRLLDECAAESLVAKPATPVTVFVTPTDLTMRADRERLRQVVINLLVNAVRASPAGGVVELEARIAQDRTIELEVRDRGSGIAPQDASRVFERLYRADPARSSSDGGSGLGLAIVKGIVDLHGGSVSVQPNDPHGCRMVVRLPQGESAS